MKEIFLLPHQIAPLKERVLGGVEVEFEEDYGIDVLTRLREILEMIENDPNTLMRIVFVYAKDPRYFGLKICGSDCRKVNNKFVDCQNPQNAIEENRIAKNLGLKMGGVYAASDLFSRV